MDCIGNPPPHKNQVEERFEPPSRDPFRGCRSKASRTRPSVSEPIEEGCVLLLPDRGGSLKRLHRPNLLGIGCISFKEKPGCQHYGGSTLIALNAGLMKPRKGFTPVTGKKKWGYAKLNPLLLTGSGPRFNSSLFCELSLYILSNRFP